MIENIVQKYSVKYASKYLVLLIDLIIVALSFFIALSVRDNFRGYDINFGILWPQILACVFLYAISSQVFRTHYGVIRHTSIADARRVLAAAILATFMLTFVTHFIKGGRYGVYYIID